MNLRLAAGLAITAAVVGACVIAEPATDLPVLPPQPPRILRTSVVPPADRIVTRWPDKFIVPVSLTNPRASFFYSYFVDFNPLTREGFVSRDESTLEIGVTASVPRVLEITIPNPDPERTPPRCHVIEVVVATTLSESDPHALPASGGDSVSWFYNPSGDFAGCPPVESGLQPDASALLSVEAGL
ncbi:MAG: hypothetical protein KIT84_22680 [Labilithrix sp.]|nr:hypothetical protein [Labilithrix sp.]MCW5813851.1 hypothetical protein [Labilithrix sp.]